MSGEKKDFNDIFGSYDEVPEFKNVDSSAWPTINANGSDNSRKNFTGEKKAQKKPQNKKSTTKKSNHKNAQLRTPKGKDMREDGRNKDNQRQYNEDLAKSKADADYEKKKQEGQSHDEISKDRKKAKKRKIKWKNVAIVFTPVIFAIIFIFLYCYNFGAPIEKINIQNTGVEYSEEEILEKSGIKIGDSLFKVRKSRVKENIVTGLPYIKDAEINLNYPDTVSISVKPTAEKYVITGQSAWHVIDKDGKVLEFEKVKIRESMYRIDGFDEQHFPLGQQYEPQGDNIIRYELMEKMVEGLEKDGTVKTAVINLKDLENVYLIYDGRIAIYFGDCEKIEKRVKNACSILQRDVGEKDTGYIDAAYNTKAYFKPGSMKKQQTPVTSAVTTSDPAQTASAQITAQQ